MSGGVNHWGDAEVERVAEAIADAEPVGWHHADMTDALAYERMARAALAAIPEPPQPEHLPRGRHNCSCGWEGDRLSVHMSDVRNAAAAIPEPPSDAAPDETVTEWGVAWVEGHGHLTVDGEAQARRLAANYPQHFTGPFVRTVTSWTPAAAPGDQP